MLPVFLVMHTEIFITHWWLGQETAILDFNLVLLQASVDSLLSRLFYFYLER